MSGKISGIYVEIKGDASQLKKELKDARQLITEQAHGMSNALANALSPAQIGKSTRALLYDLNSLANASKLTGKEFDSLGVDLKELQRLTGITEQQFQSLQSRMLQTATATAQEKALKGIATAAGLTDVEIRKLAQQMGVGEASLAKLLPPAKAVVVELSQMQKSVNQAAASLSTLSKGGGLGSISEPLAALAANSRLSEAELAKLQGRLVSVQSAKAQEQAIRSIGAATGMTADQMAALGHRMGVSQSVMRSLVESARPVAASMSAAQASVNQLAASLSTLKGGKAALGDVTTSLSVLAANSGLSSAELAKLQARLLQTSAATAQERALRDVAKAANLTKAEIQSLGRQMGVSQESIKNIIGDAVQGASVTSIAAASQSAGGGMSILASGAKTVAAAFGVLSGVMITQQLIEFGRAVIDSGIAVDSLNRSFVAIFDGTQNAAREFEFVREVALDTGQSFYTIADSYKQISASAKDTVLEGEAARELFLAMASAGSVLGLSNERMQLSFKAFSDMMSKGQVQMEELKNQLGDNLPGALNIAARGMGLTRAEVIALAKDGKLMASEVIPAMTQELQRMYGEAAKTAALDSARAAVNRLSDAWTDFKANLFDSDAFVTATNALARFLNAANRRFSGPGARELMEQKYTEAQYQLTQLETNPNAMAWNAKEGFGGDSVAKKTEAVKAARLQVDALRAALAELDKPGRADSWLSRDKGLMFADERSAGAMEALEKGRQKMLEYIQTAKEKAAVERDTHLEFARNQEERDAILKKYADTIAALDSKALKSSETAANKAAAAKAKALKEAMERNALEPYEITQLEKMNQGDMFWGKAAADKRGEDMLKGQMQDNLQLQTEFSEKYREVVLGETEFKLDQIRLQGEAYVKAGSDEVAVAQWVAAEKLKVSRDWTDGVKRGLQDYADSATNAAALAENAITSGFQGMEDALVSFITTGKLEFSDLANSIISDLARIAVQQSITGPLAGALSGFDWSKFFGGGSALTGSSSTIAFSGVSSAKGNVFSASGLHAYANSIVDRPTVFPFARGIGLMGEAGPEAIMPLKRGADGTLGVQGGGSNVVVNVIESPGNGGQRQERNEGGTTIIDVMVEQIEAKIAGNMARRQGPLYNANRSVFGLAGQPGAY